MNNIDGLWWKSGIPHPMLGRKLSEEAKLKISQKNIGKKGLSGKNNPMYGIHKVGEDAPFFGHKHSEETKNKIREGLVKSYREGKHPRRDTSGEKNPMYGVKSPTYGKQRSEEVKQKISASHIGLRPTEETKEKLKLHRAKRIFPFKDSLPEKKIQGYLKALNIEYKAHHLIFEIEHFYRCDLLLENRKVVIECDGDYWHNYPHGKELDHLRNKELIESGYKVFRLWEHTIENLKLHDFQRVLEKEIIAKKKPLLVQI